MDYFSARLIFIILIDDGKPRKKNHYDESIVVFKALDFEDAFQRALKIGRENEADYLNCDDRKVRWALVAVVSLDHIGKTVEGMEVASRLHYRTSKQAIPFRRKFHPEKSKPVQSF